MSHTFIRGGVRTPDEIPRLPLAMVFSAGRSFLVALRSATLGLGPTFRAALRPAVAIATITRPADLDEVAATIAREETKSNDSHSSRERSSGQASTQTGNCSLSFLDGASGLIAKSGNREPIFIPRQAEEGTANGTWLSSISRGR